MKKLKKIMLVCLAMILTMAFVAIPVQAAVVDDTVQPRWDNTAIINLTLGFPRDGVGCAEAGIIAHAGASKIEASVYIYRKSGLLWRYVDEGHLSVNAMNGILSCHFDATQGTEYKAEYTITVTKDGINETITKTQYRTYE